ncbi:MAG: lipopolysaccharide biosynthesis protein [Bacteroidia bacterium]|nr:lipopolysaccharide biosynthesis protein [Bacteroidia bacterium]
MADSTLKKKTTVSLFWSFLDKFGQQILNFASMLILMNIVATEDYGLIGSLAVFVAFSSILIDSGFGRALLNRKNLTESDYSTVFYFNISLSLILYLIFFFAAPLLGNIFHTPAIVNVVRILFLSLVLNALGLIQQTILTKKADFKGLTKVNMLALFIADVVAVAMAILGYGVWALVAQILLYAFFRTTFLWFHSSWRPVSKFSKDSLKAFFAFSNKLLFSSVISTTVNNIYPSLIAIFYPMNQVAYFNQAKKYQDIPFLTLSNTFRSVAMLILSEINEQTKRLKRVVSKIIKSIAFLSFPIGFVMILIAEPTFFLFFKEKWMAAVPYFQILTFAGMLSPFIFIFNELFIAKENSKYFLGIEIVKGVILVLLIILLFPRGIMALAVSWIIYMIISLFISTVLSGRLIRYNFLHFLKDIAPYLITALACTAMSYFVTQKIENTLLLIIFNLIITGTSYILLCKLMKLEMLKEIEDWFKKRKKDKQ